MAEPVNFELVKLLKEYSELINNWNDNFTTKKNGDRCFGCDKSKGYFETFSAPTIAEVVMWCFNKYKYSIEYSMNIPESGEYDGCYVFNGLIKGSEDYKLKIFYTSKDYPTVEKALEDTINHFLVNFC